jgi:hypothetical protein
MPDPMEHVQPRSNMGTIGNFSITSPIAQISPQVIFISTANRKNMVAKVPPLPQNRKVVEEEVWL